MRTNIVSRPRPEGAEPGPSRQDYVDAVLTHYRRTLGTVGHVRPHDRRLAADLYERGVPLEVVLTAFTLAAVRRGFRPASAPPLDTIRTLHYFRPVIEEILRHPLDQAYLEYLDYKLAQLERNGGVAPQPPPIKIP